MPHRREPVVPGVRVRDEVPRPVTLLERPAVDVAVVEVDDVGAVACDGDVADNVDAV